MQMQLQQFLLQTELHQSSLQSKSMPANTRQTMRCVFHLHQVRVRRMLLGLNQVCRARVTVRRNQQDEHDGRGQTPNVTGEGLRG